MASLEVSEAENQTIGENLAPFNPSMKPVIDIALGLLNLTENDVLFELGCGDGRFMITAAKNTPNLKCIGVEYDKKFSNRAQAAVETAGLKEQVTVLHANVLDVDFSMATAVFVYLVPKGTALIAEALKGLVAQGARVVSYIFSIPGMEPLTVEIHKGTKIYLYASSL